jgi:hypothetical protein
VERYRRIIRGHVYDKCWQLDITWAEVEQLLDAGEMVEESTDDDGRPKRVLFLAGWSGRSISSRSSTTNRSSSCT